MQIFNIVKKICSFLHLITKSLAKSFNDTIKHDGIEHAGYLAFLMMLAICPFLVFFVALLGNAGSSINHEIVDVLLNMILESSWAQFIDILRPRIIEITSAPPQSLITLAILSAIWTASSIFEGLRTILNKAYRVKQPPAYIFRRLLSIIEFMVLISTTIFVLIILVVMPSIWSATSSFLLEYFPEIENYKIIKLIRIEAPKMRYVVVAVSSFVFISYIYYFLPNRKHKLIYTFPGTFAVMIAWSGFTMIFKYYVKSFPQISLIYGSIAGVIIALLYFYACSLILIYGAELNYNIEHRRS